MQKTFKPTQAMISAAMTVFTAMAYTASIRPTIEGIQREVLAAGQWYNNGDIAIIIECNEKHGHNHQIPERRIITEPKDAWLISDDEAQVYFQECHNRYIAAGFNVEFGYCPLLIAENLQRQAERAFCDVMKVISGIDTDAALCSVNGLENLKELIRLNLGLLAPYCDSKKHSILKAA